jgi:hypothetical protein
MWWGNTINTSINLIMKTVIIIMKIIIIIIITITITIIITITIMMIITITKIIRSMKLGGKKRWKIRSRKWHKLEKKLFSSTKTCKFDIKKS